MEGVTYVALPGWIAAAIAILFAAGVAWAIRDRAQMGEMLSRIRERLARIEAKLTRRNGGDHGER